MNHRITPELVSLYTDRESLEIRDAIESDRYVPLFEEFRKKDEDDKDKQTEPFGYSIGYLKAVKALEEEDKLKRQLRLRESDLLRVGGHVIARSAYLEPSLLCVDKTLKNVPLFGKEDRPYDHETMDRCATIEDILSTSYKADFAAIVDGHSDESAAQEAIRQLNEIHNTPDTEGAEGDIEGPKQLAA